MLGGGHGWGSAKLRPGVWAKAKGSVVHLATASLVLLQGLAENCSRQKGTGATSGHV